LCSPLVAFSCSLSFDIRENSWYREREREREKRERLCNAKLDSLTTSSTEIRPRSSFERVTVNGQGALIPITFLAT